MTDVVHRLAVPADAPGLLELFERTKPVIARLAHPAVYNATVAEALAHRRSLIAVSERDGRLVAFAIIAWDWDRFRVSFVFRHPVAALRIAANRLRRRRRAAPTGGTPASASPPPPEPEGTHRTDRAGPRWRDGGPTIAKVLFTGVDPTLRGRGIATDLKAFYVEHLRRSGFRRVDAMISRTNVASLALQRTSGWVTTSHGADVFSYLELDGDERNP